jgi:hypothetical protein
MFLEQGLFPREVRQDLDAEVGDAVDLALTFRCTASGTFLIWITRGM